MKERISDLTTKVSKTLFDTKMFLRNKGNKYPLLFSLFGVLLSTLSVVGVTYSLWTDTAETGNNSISTGTITMRYVEDMTFASINNAEPMTAIEAYQSNNYFPFQVVMEASGEAELYYEITVTTQDTTTFSYDTGNKIRVGLKKENNIVTDAGFNIEGNGDNVNYTNGIIINTLPTSGSILNGNPQTVYKGVISSNGTETVHNFKLYLWLDENAPANSVSEKYALTINVNTGDNSPSYGKYTLTYNNQGGLGCSTKQVRPNNPWGTLCTPTRQGYEFSGWYTEQDGGGTVITSTTTATGNTTVYADYTTNTLYDVLKRATKEGTYAREYTGSHQDSMDQSLSTKKIYHWYGSDNTNGTAILDKNNVIFANHCWQMIRTTDTGGVRMIYNGEVEDGKCLNTRGTHVGYFGNRISQNLYGTYWYGTDYTYDSTNHVFSISGTTSSMEVTSNNGSTVIPTLVGKYTCQSTSESGTCSTLYLIESYKSSYGAYAISINSSSNYSQFGKFQFNADYNSPAYVGYMYNTAYPTTSEDYNYVIAGSTTFNVNHYYSNTISYNGSEYTLSNPQLISTLSNSATALVGKYILGNGGNSSYSEARFIVGASGNTLYFRSLKNGDLNTSMMIGDSYVDNRNGTYTVQNATSLTYIMWYRSNNSTLETYKGKYVCDGTSKTCSNLKHITNGIITNKSYYYWSTDKIYKYGENVSYSNGTYTLTGDIQTIWDLPNSTELNKLKTHHYTCLSSTNITCSSVEYVTRYYSSSLSHIQLTGVNNIGEALTNMLSSNGVNTKNSVIKSGIDAWYKKYLLSYDSYVDDTIYCNDRSISALNGWNPNGENVTSSLQFKEHNITTDLSCTNNTDKFSVSNNSARLTYKVGLMSAPEMNLLNNANARKTGEYYWLISPYTFADVYAFGYYVSYAGSFSNSQYHISGQNGVRPAISLKAGIEYSGGDGSMVNPYVVDTSNN